MGQIALVCKCGLAYTPDAWVQMGVKHEGKCKCGAKESQLKYDFSYNGPILYQKDIMGELTEKQKEKGRDLMIRNC